MFIRFVRCSVLFVNIMDPSMLSCVLWFTDASYLYS